ncbi:unnamed protein product, partial [Musa hybrid cultivar]
TCHEGRLTFIRLLLRTRSVDIIIIIIISSSSSKLAHE